MGLVLWVAVALLLYSYVLYPILMLWIAPRLSGRATAAVTSGLRRDATSLPTVAVVVSAFNEERHITSRLENLLGQDYPRERIQIVVGSDGSSDQTVESAR